jgi:transcriptional regulator with XRE-family HTH domain
MLRVFRGVSQKQLAKEIGTHHMSISGYERCRMKIRGSHLERMLPALKISRRAWEATLLHVTWLNQLDDAEASVREGEPGSLAAALTRVIEMQTAVLLHLVETASGSPR